MTRMVGSAHCRHCDEKTRIKIKQNIKQTGIALAKISEHSTHREEKQRQKNSHQTPNLENTAQAMCKPYSPPHCHFPTKDIIECEQHLIPPHPSPKIKAAAIPIPPRRARKPVAHRRHKAIALVFRRRDQMVIVLAANQHTDFVRAMGIGTGTDIDF